tara:strand:- start:1139 stop:1837 length:699 start_codon:yes stop_codon:yes gene_type:complete
MKIVAIIPVREGSKGLKNKNIKLINGIPLMAYTIKDAIKSKYIDKVFVSTDSKKYSKIANKYGALTPFLRPNKLSKDSSTTEDVLAHFAQYLQKDHNFDKRDILVYLQVTDLFRPKNIIDQCIKLMIDKPSLDTVFASQITHKNYWIKKNGKYKRLNNFNSLQYQPRQKKNIILREDTGIACVSRLEYFAKGQRVGNNIEIVPYDEFISSIDIHNQQDFKLAKIVNKFFKRI